MLSYSPNPSPDENYDEDRTLLRLEQAELKHGFNQFCSFKSLSLSKGRGMVEPEEWEQMSPVPAPPPIAYKAKDDFNWLIREQAEHDHLEPARTDISPTYIVIIGRQCYMLALPSVKEADSLDPEPMMPLELMAPDSDSRLFLTRERNNERFSNSTAVGIIADYDPDSRKFRHHPVFTQRAFELATLHAQAIGAVIAGARRHNPFYFSSRIEPSSVVTAIVWALECEDRLREPDLQQWPILGLSYLSVPLEGGTCEIGFLRSCLKTSHYMEQRHQVSVGLNDWGMLEARYERDSTRTQDIRAS